MDKVQLKVNVINQLKLLRQSTFKDILCFLDEDVQNAQRAKATEVKISTNYSDKEIIIENNGQLLNNPQALFSIADSEWDEDIKNTENPFGMGFFSNITVSNLMKIYSGYNLITFDVENMINTNNTEIKVETIEDFYDGFKLTLQNFDFNIATSWAIKERVLMLGKYIQGIDIYYNNELQEHKDLTEGDDSLFQLPIVEENLQGWIALGNNYSWGDNTNIFYKGRLVCKLENMPYLKGDLHISDKVLNLTSPDRKDIIKDNKLSDFKELIKLYTEKLCNETILNQAEDDIDNYTNCIGYYINKKEVKNLIKFMTFKMNKDSDYNYLQGIALAKNKNNEIKSFKDYELFLKKESSIQPESHFENIDIKTNIVNFPKEARGTVIHESHSSYTDGYVETPSINKKELIEAYGNTIINNSEPIFYISFSEVPNFEFSLNIAKHYNLKIIVARNKIEESILSSMKSSDNIFHISELNEQITVNGNLSNTELSIKEQRAMMLLEMLSRIVGFNHNVFAIGDLIVYKKIKVESINVEQEIIDENIVVLKNIDSQKVFIDRSVINQNNLRNDLEENLDMDDYKFILSNICSIAEELNLIKPNKDYMRIIFKSLS